MYHSKMQGLLFYTEYTETLDIILGKTQKQAEDVEMHCFSEKIEREL